MTTEINIDDLRQRVLAVRRGELPPDAVSVTELRAAIEAQRTKFRPASTVTGGGGKTKSKAISVDLSSFDF